jgi:hypothetical protein
MFDSCRGHRSLAPNPLARPAQEETSGGPSACETPGTAPEVNSAKIAAPRARRLWPLTDVSFVISWPCARPRAHAGGSRDRRPRNGRSGRGGTARPAVSPGPAGYTWADHQRGGDGLCVRGRSRRRQLAPGRMCGHVNLGLRIESTSDGVRVLRAASGARKPRNREEDRGGSSESPGSANPGAALRRPP